MCAVHKGNVFQSSSYPDDFSRFPSAGTTIFLRQQRSPFSRATLRSATERVWRLRALCVYSVGEQLWLQQITANTRGSGICWSLSLNSSACCETCVREVRLNVVWRSSQRLLVGPPELDVSIPVAPIFLDVSRGPNGDTCHPRWTPLDSVPFCLHFTAQLFFPFNQKPVWGKRLWCLPSIHPFSSAYLVSSVSKVVQTSFSLALVFYLRHWFPGRMRYIISTACSGSTRQSITFHYSKVPTPFSSVLRPRFDSEFDLIFELILSRSIDW